MFESLGFAQKQRLAYIEFSLLFKASIYRQDLMKRFEVGLSAASRDFSIYKQLAPNNLNYHPREKRYFQTDLFEPIFEHDAKRTLVKLANNISDGFDAIGDTHFPVESPSDLNIPDIMNVAKLVQAILNNNAVSIFYVSLSSGLGTREIVPHSIVDNGLRWHVRAFDRKSQIFKDFVLTRISKVTIQKVADTHESMKFDISWKNLIDLELVPHPKNIQFSKAIELDYGMTNCSLVTKVRAAMAGYLLRRWNVDCSFDGSLRGSEYQLWLKNSAELSDISTLNIAPGFNRKSKGIQSC